MSDSAIPSVPDEGNPFKEVVSKLLHPEEPNGIEVVETKGVPMPLSFHPGALAPQSLPAGTVIGKIAFENALGALVLEVEKLGDGRVLNMAGELLNRYMAEKQEREQQAIGAELMRPRKALSDAREKEPEGTPLEASLDPERWAMAYLSESEERCRPLSEWFSKAMAAAVGGVAKQLEILDFWAERMNVTDAESGRPLHRNPDARVWAKEFLQTIEQIERREGTRICNPQFFDEGWLISWFANAMMACYDFAMEQTAKELAGTAIVPMDYAVKAGLYHCRTHDRAAVAVEENGKPVCDSTVIGPACECVLKDPESPVES